MEGLIVLGVIIYGIYHLMSDSCEHEWEGYNAGHTCIKCDKFEKHNFQSVTRSNKIAGLPGTYTVTECSKCGCNPQYDCD